jgi:ATP-dependent protease ClpP protease subunit
MNLRDRMFARLPKSRQWYDIVNAAGERAVVRIYDEISYWGVTAADFAEELAQITAAEIEVQINSPGGDVFDGLAIYNALRTHPARIVTRVDGLAASAASVIVQAGDHRVMVQSSQLMIHEAWGVAVGPAADMLEFAAILEQQNEVIAQIYADRGAGDVDHFKQLMAAETWLTDAATIDAGLADEILVPARQSATTPTRPAASTDDTPTLDGLGLFARSKVREMFGSTALADDTTP